MRAEATKRGRAFWLGLAVILLLALSVRVSLPASKYTVWYERSLGFWEALLQGDWGGTYQRHHPGVTTMWIAGSSIRLYMATQGLSTSEMLDLPRELSGPLGPPVRVGAATLGVAIAIMVVAAYVLLCRISSWRMGFVAGWLLALDPFHITHSNMIHLDALLASFMLLSALFLVLYLKERAWGYLVASGALGGLALLTKSPALFLIPYAGLISTVDFLIGDRSPGQAAARRAWSARLWRTVCSLMVWGLVAICVFFLLWPAMWIDPLETLSTMLERGALRHAEQTHPFPQFFLGQNVRGPGLLYYPVSLAWKTTLITLPSLVLTIWFLIRRRDGEDRRLQWYLLIYAVAFLAQMSLGAKRLSRYVLPAFLAVDVLAAWGLMQVADASRAVLQKLKWLQRRGAVPTMIIAVPLLLQTVAVLRHHPYYGTHYNLLLGGSRVAQYVFELGDQGEGLDLAAQYLNGKPGAGFLTVGICDHGNLMFRENFVGVTKSIDHSDADYRVFFINDVQRAVRFKGCEQYWRACLEQGPIWKTSFDGVPYVWICPAYPQDTDSYTLDRRMDVQLGDHMELLGYDLSSVKLLSGETLTVTLFWRSDGEVAADNHVFVHLLDEEGDLVAQHDGVPGGQPTWSWQDGEVVSDAHRLAVPQDAASRTGTYTVSVGLYDYGTKDRLPAVLSDGALLPAGRIPLQHIRVTSP
jgi:hypothetical protein